jgi:hypothetical protein
MTKGLVIATTRKVRFESSVGTSFEMAFNRKRYLVSCRHIFKNVESGSNIIISLFENSEWKKYRTNIYFHKNKSIDISIMLLNQIDGFEDYSDIRIDEEISVATQTVYIAGYPIDSITTLLPNTNNHTPFYKSGVLSNIIKENEATILVIDAHNNRGFSGGPAYTNTSDGKINVIGVISSYFYQETPLYEKIVNECGETNYRELTQYFIKENTGFTYAYPIKYAQEIIDQNHI